MSKVFLSHSSKDKDSYIEKVYNDLCKSIGIDAIVYDKASFAPGEKSISEIVKHLNNSDVFVILISSSALDSPWVQHELKHAYELLKNDRLDRIFPLFIENLSYADLRIPEWLTQYNLKYIRRPAKAARLIVERMKDLSWNRHVHQQIKNAIFVGRNELINQFETRLDDYTMEPLTTCVLSGFHNMGRKSLARHCLIKGTIIDKNYDFPQISLSNRESIEDFILKLQDLGLSSEVEIKTIHNKNIAEKICLAVGIIKEIRELNEILIINDNGCLIDYRGKFSKWFMDINRSGELQGKFLFVVASKNRPQWEELRNANNLLSIHVPELDKQERIGLLRRALDADNITLPRDDMDFIAALLTGYPSQVLHAVNLIKNNGFREFKKKHYQDLPKFNHNLIAQIMREFDRNPLAKSLLTILAKFDTLSEDVLYQIIGEGKQQVNLMNRFFILSIYDYEGVCKEHIRINETVRDYVNRTDFVISQEHKRQIDKLAQESMLGEEQFNTLDMLMFARHNLMNNLNVPEEYLIPSVYLRTMLDIYEKNTFNEDVVKLARRALQNETYSDSKIIFEIRFLLCLALAKLQNEEFLKEVQNIDGSEYNFLMAFYYRKIGHNDKAMTHLKEALNKNRNYSRAKRELVLVYKNLQFFEEATTLARENYSSYPGNHYHIQAYFDCLIRSGEKDSESICKELLDNLKDIRNNKAQSMYRRCNAQYMAYVLKSRAAYAEIDKAIEEFPNDRGYAYGIKFEIADVLDDVITMEEVILILEKNRYYKNNVVLMRAKVLSKKGRTFEAISYFKANIKNFTDASITNFCERLQRSPRFKSEKDLTQV